LPGELRGYALNGDPPEANDRDIEIRASECASFHGSSREFEGSAEAFAQKQVFFGDHEQGKGSDSIGELYLVLDGSFEYAHGDGSIRAQEQPGAVGA
jgi:hypothetical protein